LDTQSPSARHTSTNIWMTFLARSKGVSTSTLNVPFLSWARQPLSIRSSSLDYGMPCGSYHLQNLGSKKSLVSSRPLSCPTSLPHPGGCFAHPRSWVDLVSLILVPRPPLSNFDMCKICCQIFPALAAK
jgi:hypothetical protein